MSQTPLILGHRGASGEAPENTLAAFDLAYQQGADGIELDVFLAKDGHVVVTHDENLLRLTGANLFTRKLTLRELKQLDFGLGEKIPTLSEVLGEFGKKFSLINIEIKSTGFFSDGIESALIACLDNFSRMDNIIISSFNFLQLRRMKQRRPDWHYGQLIDYSQKLSSWPGVTRLLNLTSLHLNHADITAKRRDYFLSMNKKIIFWTVNTTEEFLATKNWNPYAIITNFPGRMRQNISP